MWNEGSHWSSWASAGGQNPASLTREGIERVDFYKKHDWISQLCCPLPPLASQQVLFLAGSWSCQGPEMCFWSYIPGGFAFLSQASVDFAAGHLSPLRSSSQSWTVLTLRVAACVCVCVCLCVSVCLFFFNLCFPSLKCWDLGGVSFRKPSLANVHDHSLLLMLTHCLHFLLLGICLLCARLGPGEELVGKTCRWGTCIQMVKQLFDTAGPLHVGHLRCQKHRGVLFKKLKTAILSDWASVSLTGFG